jgi:1-acyl-sn-glycerol-3-phosphate acyltransferase
VHRPKGRSDAVDWIEDRREREDSCLSAVGRVTSRLVTLLVEGGRVVVRSDSGRPPGSFAEHHHPLRTRFFKARDHRKRAATSTEVRTMDRVSGPVGYRLAKALLSRPLRRLYNIEVDGDRRLPDGPAIVTANHRSFMDSIFLALVIDRPVSFLAKAEYFDRRRTAWVFRSTGQIPLRRGSPSGARRALDAALGVLAHGGVVGVYPEGTRSRDGMLYRGTLGPARLAAASGAPIVPVGLVGTDLVQPPDQRLPRVKKEVQVRFGTPLRLDRQDANDRAHLRDATDTLMNDIAALCGQEYVDRHAPLANA